MQLHKKIAIGVLGFAGVMTAVFANTPSSIISPTNLENIFPGISNRESPIRYIWWWNEFNGMFLWRDEEFLVTPEVVTDGTTTYNCRAKLKGVYYNNQRWNRRWPLDDETKTLLANNDSSYNNITISGWLFSFCNGMPSRNTVGQITHTNTNGGPVYKLIGWGFNPNLSNNTYSFATLPQQNAGAFLTSGSLKWYWKNAFWFIYDSAGWLGEVCGGRWYNRYSQNGGTGENRTGYAIVNRCVPEGTWGWLSGWITTPDTSSGNMLSGGGLIVSWSHISGTIITWSVLQLSGTLIFQKSWFLGLIGNITIKNDRNWDGIIVWPTIVLPWQDGYVDGASGWNNRLPKDPLITYKIGSDAWLEFTQGLWIISVPSTRSEGKILTIYRSNDGINWSKNSPNKTCTVQSDGNCTFETNHLSYFAIVNESSSSNNDNDSPKVTKDECPDGDRSASYYDDDCGTKTKAVIVLESSGKQNIDLATTLQMSGSIVYSAHIYTYRIGDNTFSIRLPIMSSREYNTLANKIHTAVLEKFARRYVGTSKQNSFVQTYEKLLAGMTLYLDHSSLNKNTRKNIFLDTVTSFVKIIKQK